MNAWKAMEREKVSSLEKCIRGGIFTKPFDINTSTKDSTGERPIEYAIQNDKFKVFTYIIGHEKYTPDYAEWSSCVNCAISNNLPDALQTLVDKFRFKIDDCHVEHCLESAGIDTLKLLLPTYQPKTKKCLALCLKHNLQEHFGLLFETFADKSNIDPNQIVSLFQEIQRAYSWWIERKTEDKIITLIKDIQQYPAHEQLKASIKTLPADFFPFAIDCFSQAKQPFWVLTCLLFADSVNIVTYIDSMKIEALQEYLQTFIDDISYIRIDYFDRFSYPVFTTNISKVFEDTLKEKCSNNTIFTRTLSFYFSNPTDEASDESREVTNCHDYLGISQGGSNYIRIIPKGEKRRLR